MKTTLWLILGFSIAFNIAQANAANIFHTTTQGDIICPTSSDMAIMAATMRHVEKEMQKESPQKASKLLDAATYRAEYIGCLVAPTPFDFNLTKIFTKHVPRIISKSKFGNTLNNPYYVGNFKMAFGNYFSEGHSQKFFVLYKDIAKGSLTQSGSLYKINKKNAIACSSESITSEVNNLVKKNIAYAGLKDLFSNGDCRKLPKGLKFRALSFDSFSRQSGIGDLAYGVQIVKGLPPVFFYVMKTDINPVN